MNAPDPMLASELITKAARLVRAVRNEGQYPAASLRVLSIIDERGPSRVTTLASLDQCSQPSMTGTVNGLEAKCLVTRQADPADARAQLVHLTDDGVKQLQQYRHYIGTIVLGWAEGTQVKPAVSASELQGALDVLNELLQRSGHVSA